MNKLIPDVKAKTLDLLRGGTIKKTTGRLINSQGCRCVLGVIALAGDLSHCAEGTMDEAGEFNVYEGFKDVGLEHEDCVSLYLKNDLDGLTFHELADHIEANL